MTSTTTDVVARLAEQRLVAVVVIDDARTAEPLGEALSWAGLTCVEVTLRTPAALESLRILAQRPELCVGAGTVLSASQVDSVVEAGARFVVSPGTSLSVVVASHQAGVPIFPGVATPTEIQSALELGVNTLKFFPAETLGGLSALTALSGPFADVRFVPTGGVGPANLAGYLAHSSVLAVGGSWMATRAMLSGREFTAIRHLATAAVHASGDRPVPVPSSQLGA
jgi:2-dehydro-3-deoxyphosphogluconate aldolase/(4S)-4-hydroxy-2-oxoglutarate aldolase